MVHIPTSGDDLIAIIARSCDVATSGNGTEVYHVAGSCDGFGSRAELVFPHFRGNVSPVVANVRRRVHAVATRVDDFPGKLGKVFAGS